MSNSRLVALEAIIEILENNKHADEVLSSAFANHQLDKKDRALATELIYGITRKKLTLDYLISKISKRPVDKLPFNIKNILRMAVYQLEFTRIPEYAVVNSSVEMAKKLESHKVGSFVNGVLRNLIKERTSIKFPDISKEPESSLSIEYSHPRWMVKRWLARFGLENTINLLKFNNTPPQITINVNRLKSSKEEVIKELSTENITVTESIISPYCLKIGNVGNVNQLPGFNEGHWFIQDECSSLIADIMKPQKEETIVDLCAAPGTKTVAIANYMENTGKIYAVEISENRINKIHENCNRLNVSNIETIQADGTKFCLPEGTFADRVLVDAPCSNTGVLAKRADARWQRNNKDINKLGQLQLDLLSNAANLLKNGGIIVYSVCSIELEEGPEVIKKFLERNKNFELIDIREELSKPLNESFDDYYLSFLPFKHSTDGFFISCLKKSG